jgi:regulator of sigma D
MKPSSSASTQTQDSVESKQTIELDKVVTAWLKERQTLIVLLCAVHGLREIMPKETPIAIKIQAFCQVMMDYVSAGHFEVYGKLRDGVHAQGEEGDQLLSQVYPKIDMTTDKALAFNDKYETVEKCGMHIDDLDKELSIIAEHLSKRFDLEDQLIAALHQDKNAI